MKKKEKRFTLIEIVLIVGIIAMLTTIFLPRFSTFNTTTDTPKEAAPQDVQNK
jgi:type II secretory pathway pseudopilin PulG